MLNTQEFLEDVLEIVRIQAQLEELKRIDMIIARNTHLANRRTDLEYKLDTIINRLDKETKPMELAPIEQYIDIVLEPHGL